MISQMKRYFWTSSTTRVSITSSKSRSPILPSFVSMSCRRSGVRSKLRAVISVDMPRESSEPRAKVERCVVRTRNPSASCTGFGRIRHSTFDVRHCRRGCRRSKVECRVSNRGVGRSKRCWEDSKLEDLFTIRRRRNVELVAIFRHRAAGDVDALVVEDLHDLRVRERLARIFALDEALDLLLHGQAGDVLARIGVDAAVEEI